MKIAVCSDIHANILAFEAVLNDLDQQAYDAIFCLGDLVGYNVFPNEIIDLIRKRKIPTIMGNHDEAVGISVELANENNLLTQNILTEENRQFLLSLPRHLRLNFVFNEKNVDVLLVHGGPNHNRQYIFEDFPEMELLELMRENKCNILLCGHSHLPYHRTLVRAGERFDVINVGSIGKPKDGDNRAGYIILDLTENACMQENFYDLKVEFRRVNYDVTMAVQFIRNSSFSNIYADAILLAK